MAKIPGLNISAPVVPAQDSDAYPSHRAMYGHGGWREVTNTTERDAISQARREAGMAVYVTSEKSVYILNDDLVTWTLLEQGKVDDVQIKTSTNGNFETVVTDKIAKIDLSNINASIDTIEGLIPTQASTTNQLADKDFVNSSISTNTAIFIGTFQSLEELNSYQGTLTDNDYAFVITKDENNNTAYERYKYTTNDGTGEWKFEYTLNNSSFTAEQWAAINSNATPDLIAQISNNKINIENHIADTSNPHAVTKAQVGLGNVDNTSDIDKPISTATQTALNAKQDTLTAGINMEINNNTINTSATKIIRRRW